MQPGNFSVTLGNPLLKMTGSIELKKGFPFPTKTDNDLAKTKPWDGATRINLGPADNNAGLDSDLSWKQGSELGTQHECRQPGVSSEGI